MARDARRASSSIEAAPDSLHPPKTALGRQLWKLRQQILAEGDRPLGWDALEREIAERRGERRDDD